MKKIVFTFLLLRSVLSLAAQNITPEELQKYVNENYPELDKSFKEDDYVRAEKSYVDMLAQVQFLRLKDQKKFTGLRSHLYYQLARAYAFNGKPEEAIESFGKAIDNGFCHPYVASHEKEFESIRNMPEFREQLERLEEYDYLTVLKSERPYREDLTPPSFSYQQPDAEELVALRREFNLDSVAGNGDDISRIKNIMTWVHDTVPHDGGNSPDVPRTASALISYFKETGRGVNCRMMATILNECYLSLGIPSRFITCLPHNSADPECHVINSVWSETLDKWLWMDPSFNAWVMDEAGSLLSIREVRDRAIADQPLFINPDANWNGNPQTKEGYLDGYMYKNLFWFECSSRSSYGTEFNRDGFNRSLPVRLCPPGYYGRGLVNCYVTRDADYFWQRPA